MSNSYRRQASHLLEARLREARKLIQVVMGPRQVGKTTLVRQAIAGLGPDAVYASADDPALQSRTWIGQQWDLARLRCSSGRPAVLVLDEIQKIPDWSGIVKALWDEDSAQRRGLHVVLLGSAPWLLQRGLGESLAGRFETSRVGHWAFSEMRDAFGWSVEQFIAFGGYPGAATLVADFARWRGYILDSLVETTLSRDIMLMTRVDKPALLRRLFHLACTYSGRILSYQKMVGQLQDAGNTTTLAHYLDLLAGAGLVAGIPKFAGEAVRQRASSPKLQACNTALVTSQDGRPPEMVRLDREYWGHLVESAIGAHLFNCAFTERLDLYYWRDRGREVDFVVKAGDRLCAIEVKSTRSPIALPGMSAFDAAFQPTRKLLVGPGGIPIEDFLARSVVDFL